MNIKEAYIHPKGVSAFIPDETEGDFLPEVTTPVLIVIKTGLVQSYEVGALSKMITLNELAKSQRFHFQKDRIGYIVGHGILRLMLGRYLGIPPGAVTISYNSYGKPLVTGHTRRLFFSMSHSEGVTVLAFDPENEIGADVERLDEKFEYEPVVEQYFSSSEQQYIYSSREDSRKRFYEIWTRKEAFLKAIGTGITKHLSVDVLREKMSGKSLAGNESGSNNFSFRSMLFEENCLITLAIASDPGLLHSYYLRNIRTGLLIKKEAG